jgi:arabinofuranosyltransferase
MSEGHSPPRRWGIVEWSLLGAALAAYVSTVRPFYGVTADDAFISFRYGLSWASGCGPVYNCGQPPVEGYSNFLWVALSALVLRLGLDVVAVMRAVGLAGGFCALVLVALVCRRVNRERAAVVAPLLGLASSPFWAVNAVSGLETLVATTSVLGAAYLTLGLAPGGAPPASGGRELRRPLLAGLAWALAYLVRPEGLPLAAVSGIWTLAIGVSRGRSWRASLTRAALVAAGFLAVAAPYFLWRACYYRALLPNSFEAKRDSLRLLLWSNLKILAGHPLFFLSILGTALAVLLIARRGEQLYLLLLAAASAAISLGVHNNFWMPGHRLYLTAAALLAIVAGGVADLGRVPAAAMSAWRAIGPVMALLGALLLSSWRGFAETKELADLHYARDDHPAAAMGRHIRDTARAGEWLAIRDAGMVPFFAGTGVNVLDMHERSLNDRRIARHGWDLEYILSHRPRFIVLVSPHGHQLALAHDTEVRLYFLSDFVHRYRWAMTVPWNRSRFYFLFSRHS